MIGFNKLSMEQENLLFCYSCIYIYSKYFRVLTYVAKIVDERIVINYPLCFSSKIWTMLTTASNIFVYRMFLINTEKAPKMVGWLLLLLVVVVKWYFGGWIIHPNCKYMIIIQKRKEVWKNWIKLTTTLVMPPFVQSKSSCVVFQQNAGIGIVYALEWQRNYMCGQIVYTLIGSMRDKLPPSKR